MIWPAITVTVALFVAAFADGAEPESLPDVVRYKRADVVEPVWVSEKAALDERGELRLDLFSARAQASFRQSLQQNADGTCRRKLIEPAALSHPFDALDSEVVKGSPLDFAVSNASIAVAGTVASTTRGFHHGFPGVLAAITLVERLKEVAPLSGSKTLYVFFPGATISTRSGVICSSALPSSPRAPEAGDRLVVFAVGSPVDEYGRILEADVRRNVLIQPAGTKQFIGNELAGTIEEGEHLDTILESIRKHDGRRHVPRRIRQ